MSYLQRLAIDAQRNSDRPQLQPFIRSTSPIADYDQRIGMPDFEGGLIPSGVMNRENEGGIGEDFSQNPNNPLPSSISSPRSSQTTNVNRGSEPILQRKIASSTPNIAPSAPKINIISDKPSAFDQISDQNEDSNLPVIADSSNIEQKSTESPNYIEQNLLKETSPSPFTDPIFDPALSPQPSDVLNESPTLNPIKTSEFTQETETVEIFSSPASTLDENSLLSSDSVQFGELNPIRWRTIEETPSDKLPSLNPSPRSLRDIEPSPFASNPLAEAEKTVKPNVVIGRINVEVVSPPTVEVSQTKASQPLTADSISVIGSLGNPIRPSVRFSLRQR